VKTNRVITLYLRSCRAKGLSKRTIQWYGEILKNFAGLYPELPDKPASLETFINSCRAGDERRHGYFRTLRAFYNFAEKRLEFQNPMHLVTAPKRQKKLPRPLTLDQLIQLLSFPHPGRIKGALIFLTDTGVRVGELAGLVPGNFIQTEWGYFAVVKGKTGPRAVPVSQVCYEFIIPGSAHSLRHTFGTLWRGGDLSILQKIMGHSNISTTMLYRQVQYDQLAMAHKEYSPLRMVLSVTGNLDII
jgi:site-specific recombinase XerD